MPSTARAQFARLVARGMKLSEAYEKTHTSKGGKKKTRQIDASRLAKQPDVKAMIEKYEPLLTPVGDYGKCREEMLANLRRLALDARDERVQLMATKTLHDICAEYEVRVKRKVLPAGEMEAIVGELLEISGPEKQTIDLAVVDQQAEAQNAQDEAAATEAANAGEEPEEASEDSDET